MSIYSTRQLSREKALAEIKIKIMELILTLDKLPNDKLESIMFNLIGGEWNENSPLNNYSIV